MRLWATDLETWRYWRAFDGGPESLLAKLRREEPVPEHVDFGSEWHKVLEECAQSAITLGITPGIAELRLERGESITRDFETEDDDGNVRAKLRFVIDEDFRVKLAPKPESRFELALGEHTVTGRADGVYPANRTVVEYKTSPNVPTMENYADSLQWRVYLLAAEAQCCRYEAVQLFRSKRQDIPGVLELRVRNPAEACYWRYDNMRTDVEEAVHGFVTDTTEIGWEGR